MLFNVLISPILRRLSLWWLGDILSAQHTAALVNRRTLRAGRTELLTESEASLIVEASLDKQILVIEAIMGMSEDS